MRVLVTRTKMATREHALSYDVYVPFADAEPHNQRADANGNTHTRTVLSSPRIEGDFLRYVDATTSAEHRAMPQGCDRYDSYLRHERAANVEMLALLQRAFPETEGLTAFPSLWVTGIGDGSEGHAHVWIIDTAEDDYAVHVETRADGRFAVVIVDDCGERLPVAIHRSEDAALQEAYGIADKPHPLHECDEDCREIGCTAAEYQAPEAHR